MTLIASIALMDAESAPPADSSVQALLSELGDAAGLLDELADELRDPYREHALAKASQALRRASRTVEGQDGALRTLVAELDVLGRQLVDSHSRFAEWTMRPLDPVADAAIDHR